MVKRFVIIANEVLMYEKYLVELEEDEDIDNADQLELAQERGEWLGEFAKDTGDQIVSRSFYTREEALASEEAAVNVAPREV